MRLLYVHSGNLFGGVETLMLTLVKHQQLCPDMEPHFALCFSKEGLRMELLALGAPGYELENARVSRPLTIRRARRNLRPSPPRTFRRRRSAFCLGPGGFWSRDSFC